MATNPMPYTFGTATSAIPLSQLDTNFATPITLGNTAVYLNNTYSSIGNLSLANVTITSGTITITNVAVTTANVSGTANVSTLVVVGNETVGGNTTITGNITAANANVTSNLVLSGGTANGVAYLNTSKQVTTGSALVFDGTNLNVTSGRVRAGGGSDEGTQLNLWTTGGGDGTIAAYQLAFNVGANSARTGAMFLTASGNLGIGITSPVGRLNVKSTYVSDTTTQQRFEDNTGSALNFGGTGGGVKWINVADVATPSTGYALAFQTGGTERARFNTTGAFVLAGGTTTADGIGITFPATQSASSNANTLDDYEEGTFTPVLTGTNGGTATYSVQVGRYRKIGSFVCVWARVDLATVGTLNGFITVDNLPFASQNTTNYYSIGTVLLANTTFTGVPVSFINPNSTNAYLLLSVSGATVGFVSNTDLTSSTSVTICICYHTA
jgi:hypothetical protein